MKIYDQFMCYIHVTIGSTNCIELCSAAEAHLVDLNENRPQYDEFCLHKLALKTLASNRV